MHGKVGVFEHKEVTFVALKRKLLGSGMGNEIDDKISMTSHMPAARTPELPSLPLLSLLDTDSSYTKGIRLKVHIHKSSMATASMTTSQQLCGNQIL